jgi:histidine decarboxylase
VVFVGNGRTARADADTQQQLDALLARLTTSRATNIGFPAAFDLDFAPLAPLFTSMLLNNLGDPAVDGDYPNHTKPQEREALDAIATLLRAPVENWWGYVTSGATEGSEYALWQARLRYPEGLVYHSAAAHHSIAGVLDRLAMPSVRVRTDELGEMDYDDLAGQVERHRHRPVIVVANIGTAMAEAVDDVRHITAVLDDLAVQRRWVHADAALSGIPLALLDPDGRPGFDMQDGADSIIVSGHKFPGAPIPYGVVLVRASHRASSCRDATYTGSPDTTISNSRSGLAALCLWYTLRRFGLDGLRERATRSRNLAAYTHSRLVEIGWPAHRHPHAFTVVLAEPSTAIVRKWALATQDGQSHIVCMPGVTPEQVDALIADLRAEERPMRSIPAQRRRSGLLARTRQPASSTT